MFYFNTLNLNQIGGGNQVKQGDFGSTFTYKLTDEKNQELDVFDQKTAYVNLVLNNNIVFTTTVIVDGSTVTFNIDKAIPTGLYFLEIKIDSHIFPSDRQTIILVTAGAVAYDLKDLVPNYDANMTISSILSDLSQKGIDISDLKTKMNAIYNNALADHAEIATARGGLSSLDARLDGLDAKDTDLQNQVNTNKASITTTDSRINNLIANAGNGTVPSEVIDARIADDGTVFQSVGSATRSQFNLIKKSLIKSINLFNFANAKDGYYSNYGSGNTSVAASHTMSEYISVKPSTQYLVYSNEQSNLQLHVAFFDSSKSYISGTQYGSFITPTNAAYAVISFLLSYKSSVVFSKGQFSRSKTYIPYYTVKKASNDSYTLSAFNDRQQTPTGTTVSNQYDTSFDMSFDGQGRVLFTKNVSGLGSGEFYFGRATIVADTDVTQVNIQVVGADGVYYNNIYGNIKAGKTYNLYFNTAKFTGNSNPKQYFQINAIGNGPTTIKFSNVCFINNGYDCYYDDATLKSLPVFDTTKYTIGLDGQNHFFDIAQACEFVKRAHDVDNVPVTLFIRNGEYEVLVSDNLPYAIFKGGNKISLIGESKSGVVITKKCTATNQGKIIEAGGECTLANFTIRQINDGTYNQSNDYGSNPYCIHLDRDPKNHDTKYVTDVSNVTAYNNVNAPIGCGLRDHQTLVFDNVETIYEAPTGVNGAFYVHGPNDPTATDCELKVNASTFNHNSLAGYCINTGNVEGCLPFTEIPVTFTRNSFGTKANMVRNNFKSEHQLTAISSLNNVVELNY